MHNVTPIEHCFQRKHDSSAQTAAVKDDVNAGNNPVNAAGYSLPTDIYYLSQVLVPVQCMSSVFAQLYSSDKVQRPSVCSHKSTAVCASVSLLQPCRACPPLSLAPSDSLLL